MPAAPRPPTTRAHRRCLISAEQSWRTNPLLSVCRYGPQMEKVPGYSESPAACDERMAGRVIFPISLLRTRGILLMVFAGDGAWRAVALPFARCRTERGRILLCWVNVLGKGGSRGSFALPALLVCFA